VRATEIIRDVRQDAYAGRLYLPLEMTDQYGLKHEDLREKELPSAARQLLASLSAQLRQDFTATLASIPTSIRAYFRPLYVLGELHATLLQHIANRHFDVGTERIELGPLRKPWVAWRAARRAG
jgi:15-cis-phytoene synthase